MSHDHSEPASECDEFSQYIGNNESNPSVSALTTRVYEKLLRIASRNLAREKGNHCLQPADLVHEAYLRLIQQESVRWKNSAHFLAVASIMMRRIMIDQARTWHYQKRGGEMTSISLDDASHLATKAELNFVALSESLDALAAVEPEQAEVVFLRYFMGLSAEDISGHLGISTATVTRRWRLAKRWLQSQLCVRSRKEQDVITDYQRVRPCQNRPVLPGRPVDRL